jgi:hypothetical protein
MGLLLNLGSPSMHDRPTPALVQAATASVQRCLCVPQRQPHTPQ